MKKDKVLKIIAIICLIPIILSFLDAIYSSIHGFTFFSSTDYGLGAFLLSLLLIVIKYWPMYLICIGYLLFYLFYLFKNYRKVKNGKIYIYIITIVFLIALFSFLLMYFG